MTVGVAGMPPGAQRKSTGDDWLTDPALLKALGPMDLDPCASVRQPWPTAKVMWTVYEDGFSRAWPKGSFVWLNSPYGAALWAWVARLADHGDGLALLYARTETQGFRAHVWDRADAVYFFAGRLWFHKPVTGEQAPHNCGGPMVLACYGEEAVRRAAKLEAPGSAYPGKLVRLRGGVPAAVPRGMGGGRRGKK